MIDALLNAEFSILNLLYGMHNPILDKIMVFVTHLGDKGLIWIFIGLAMCFAKKYRRAGVNVLLALLIGLIVGNLTLKPLVARIRPYEYIDGIKLLIEVPTDFSFPSGHSFSSFAAAYSVFLFHKKEGITLLVLALIIAVSRLYIYVHFPTDVLTGALLGIGVAYLSRYIVNRF